jgi:hypothetical protein
VLLIALFADWFQMLFEINSIFFWNTGFGVHILFEHDLIVAINHGTLRRAAEEVDKQHVKFLQQLLVNRGSGAGFG